MSDHEPLAAARLSVPSEALAEALERAMTDLWRRRRGPGPDDLPPDLSADAAFIASRLTPILAAPPNREDAPERNPDEAAMFAFYTSPAASPGGKVKFWSELTDAERDHWRALTTPYVPALVREDAPSREGLDAVVAAVVADLGQSDGLHQYDRGIHRMPGCAACSLRARLAAALAATPPGDREDGLDVDALAEAVRAAWIDGHRDGEAWGDRAEAIAAIYGRLIATTSQEAAVTTTEAAAGEEGS